MKGWIRLHRKLLDSRIFSNEKLLKIWIWCLLNATYQDYNQLIGNQNVELKSGQFVFGRKSASEELGMSESMFYRNIKLLQSMRKNRHQIEQQIFCCNYCKMGGLSIRRTKNEQPDEQQTNSK